MIYLDFRNIYGRMCNHFYLALQAFIFEKWLNQDVKYLTSDYFYKNNVLSKMKMFNMDRFVNTNPIDYNVRCKPNWGIKEYQFYHQIINKDFDICQLEEFIKCTFLSTNLFNDLTDDTIGIHIRFGDYVQSKISNCFDKKQYIIKSLNKFNLNKIHVFSDDISMCKDLLYSMNLPHVITFSDNKIDTLDFIQFSCFKYKILWNSTFSYWSAFIGNVLFNNSYNCVCSPAKFTSNEPLNDHNNPLWNNIIV